MFAYLRLWIPIWSGWFRGRRDLVLENAALRQQLAMYERRRPQIRDADRWFLAALTRLLPDWKNAVVVVRPETVVRWHRAGWRRYWSWKSRSRRSGRPRISVEARELISRLARENPNWGAVRIHGELRTLGFDISAETVRRHRLRARRRPPTRHWREFLHNHRHEIWAADFFTVPTLTLNTLYVFFMISHGRRRIEHFNVTQHPTAEWVWRQMIEATPWNRRPRFLIRDRDRAYGRSFIARAKRIGIETVLTPVHAPQANAIAERLVGTFERECVDHTTPRGEQHLRGVLREYVDYYNATRPHRTLELEPPHGPRSARWDGKVVSIPVLGGIHHRYERQAA